MAKGSSERGSGTGKSTGASTAKKAPGSKSSRARKPPPVVTNNPKPWGWIAAAVVVALFAAAAIGYAVQQVGKQEELANPANIEGLQTKSFTSSQHVTGAVDYGEDSPPFGGEHDIVWADCMGTVYPIPIRNENAVHGLEHGAVWLTYDPELPQDQIDQLAGLVEGEGFTMMSPYPGLQSAVSLQAWGNQLFVDSVDDPRIEQFITALRQNPDSTPEPGATCDRPDFAANPIPADIDTGADPTDAATSGAPDTTTDPAASTAP